MSETAVSAIKYIVIGVMWAIIPICVLLIGVNGLLAGVLSMFGTFAILISDL